MLQQVRALRAQGYSPKAIARTLGRRPADVRPLVRAAAQQEGHAPGASDVVGCWVSPGWSARLTVPASRGWPDAPAPYAPVSGLVGVVLARTGRRSDETAMCGYVVDTYCLGVKDAFGPRRMPRHELRPFVDRFFQPFRHPPVDAPLELARHLVWGAVAYARDLGFEPHPDFHVAADHLGALDEPSAIGFGCDGKPVYVEGAHDDSERILATLERRLGRDGYDFLVSAPISPE